MHSTSVRFLQGICIFSERDQNQSAFLLSQGNHCFTSPCYQPAEGKRFFHTALSALCFWSKTWANVFQLRAMSYLLFISSCTHVTVVTVARMHHCMAASESIMKARQPEAKWTQCEGRLVPGKHSNKLDSNTWHVISQVWALFRRSWAEQLEGRRGAEMQLHGKRKELG